MRLTMALSLPREATSVRYARHVLNTLLNLLDVTDSCRNDIALMITEACSNAVLHANLDRPIEVAIVVDSDECLVEVSNPDGIFTDTQLNAEPPDPLAEGGRGLQLIAALADRTEIARPRPGWVVLRMAKHLAHRTSSHPVS